MRILVISPPLVIKNYRARWYALANEMEEIHHVRALVPTRRIGKGYGKATYVETEQEVVGRFELKCVEVTSDINTCYRIKNLRGEISDFSPDLIFCVHHETTVQLLQTIIWRKLFFRKVRLVYFSMTAFERVPKMRHYGPKEWLKKLYFWGKWWLIRHGTDAALCHYDRIEKQMRAEGYRKAILQQTQYGVDPEQFKPDPAAGAMLRDKLGFGSAPIIGFCGRFVPEKGLPELLSALEQVESDWQLLLVGDGDLRDYVEKWVAKHGHYSRVRQVGFIPHTEVHAYFQVMDIFYLGSRETEKYIDTFPLVVAQAMMVGLPVIGSISGAIPYQLGGLGRLFPEGDSRVLKEHLLDLMKDGGLRQIEGRRLRERSLGEFSVFKMNEIFIKFLKQLT